MEKSPSREHDFSAKLRQSSVVERLRAYVDWKRSGAPKGTMPQFGPLSINLDLTAACNFACPHCVDSGIINTVNYARLITGIDAVFAVMGGFHLTGPQMAPAIEPTVKALKEINPTYVIPTHCTGRDAVYQVEKTMPDRFILNMVGTTLTFSSANT